MKNMCITALAVLAMLPGCGGLRLHQRIVMDENDWSMFAGSATRSGVATGNLAPPFTRLWEHDVTSGFGSGSPLVVDSFLILGNLRGELYVVNVRSGKRVGWVDIGDAINGTPVFSAGVVYVPVSNSDESLIAFDLSGGKARWSRNYGDIEASPLLLEKKLYVGNTQGAFFCVDAETGDQIWKYELAKNTQRKGIRSSAASDGNVVIFGTDDGALYALDARTGVLQWSRQTGATIMATPCIAGGTALAGNTGGTMTAVRITDGTLAWTYPAGAGIYSTPVLTEGLGIFGTTGGSMVALREDGSTAWITNVGGVVSASGALSGTTLFVGTLKKEFLALDALTGSILWRDSVAGRIKSSPAIAGGRVFIATDERLVIAYAEKR